jgi:hypothetical protein
MAVVEALRLWPLVNASQIFEDFKRRAMRKLFFSLCGWGELCFCANVLAPAERGSTY